MPSALWQRNGYSNFIDMVFMWGAMPEHLFKVLKVFIDICALDRGISAWLPLATQIAATSVKDVHDFLLQRNGYHCTILARIQQTLYSHIDY